MRVNMSRRIGVVALAAVMLTAGCGGPTGETFVDNGEQTGNQYERLASKVMEDGNVTNAELEQVFEAIVQCYTEQHLAGEYAYDVNADPWIGIPYQLGRDHPDFALVDDVNSPEGKRTIERVGKAMDKASGTCNGYFRAVEDHRISTVDYGALAAHRYRNLLLCVSNIDADMAAHIESTWPATEEGLRSAHEYLESSSQAQGLAQQTRESIWQCIEWDGEPVRRFGVQ